MLRYLRSRIGGSYEIKNDDFDDFISYTKIATHGFPQRISSFDIDEKNGLIAIGTKDGRLEIYESTSGMQIRSNIEGNPSIMSIYFIQGANVLILLCSDRSRKGSQQFYRCQIVDGQAYFTLLNQEIHLKRITCCEVLIRSEDGNSALLIGTIIGNIYALWTQNMELTEFLVFLDTSLTEINELNTQEKSIDAICIHPDEHSKLFLLFNNSIVLYYDTLHDSILRKFVTSDQITHLSLGPSTKTLFASYKSGVYSIFDIDGEASEIKKPFGDMKCLKMKKILSSASTSINEQFIIFSGGLPEALEGRNTITILCGDKSLILDFDSTLLDFEICWRNEVALALFVLCEEEIVAIDLQDPLWRMFPLPYLYPIHFSPITYVSAISGLTSQANMLLTKIAKEQQNSSKIFSKNQWPLENEFWEQKTEKRPKDLLLIITGHENGVVNIWLAANDLTFRLWLSCNTARDFEGYREDDEREILERDDGEESLLKSLPPFRKVGVFDPYSDDHRLCIQKIHFDQTSGQFAVGGKAGQLMVYEGLSTNKILPANELILLDMVESSLNCFGDDSRRGESAIQPRSSQVNALPGFSLINNVIAQFKPPVPVTAISWNSNSGLLAAGNEFGYAVVSLTNREVLLVKTLISSLDVVEISYKDSAISRFKSVKKSIRQSFRKKKKPGEIENEKDLPRLNRGEREIVQRKANPNALEGETPNSLVKVLSFKTCNLSSINNCFQTYLFIGTHGGTVLIHATHLDGQVTSDEQCPLIKEIKLQHHAPIVAIECLQQSLSMRLLIFSEEQIRSFMLPSLKPSNFKYRFTAVEGSRIRRAVIVQLSSRVRRMRNSEKFLSITTNRGEIFLLHPSNPKKPYKVHFTQPTDSAGILSSVVTQDGQLFYLKPGGSEFNQSSLSAISQNQR